MADLDCIPIKICSKCKKPYPKTSEYFYMRANGRWVRSECKNCTRGDNDQWKVDNRETHKRHSRESMRRMKERDPDYNRRAEKRRDPIKHAAKTARYEAKNRERRKQMNLEWQRNHRARIIAIRHRREARVKGLSDSYSVDDWMRAVDYFEGRCAVCGALPHDKLKIAADHWIPLASPDCIGTVLENIVPLCHGVGGCNNSKRDKHPRKWLINKFGMVKAEEVLDRIEKYFEWVKQND